MFKSARSPVRFVFSAASWTPQPALGAVAAEGAAAAEDVPASIPREPVQMIFKSGDDLRQDQFVCQVITPPIP